MSQVDKIRIRMYHTGSVGDCLLLLFEKAGVLSFSMLIDCGGFQTRSSLVTPCVQDIQAACGGQLDLLVLTHEHEDHISGFNQARALFDQITVKEVWMSWVEDKNDEVAQILKKKFGKKLKELRSSVTRALAGFRKLSAHTGNVKGAKERFAVSKRNLENTLELIDFEEGKIPHGTHLAAGKRTNNDAIEYVRGKGHKIDYKLPGEVVKDLAGAEGIKFYFLGPPRDKDLGFIKIEEEEDEMFHLAANGQPEEELLAMDAMSDGSGEDPERLMETGILLEDGVSPFAEEFHLKGREKSLFLKPYHTDNRWRQIETDWLLSSTDRALALTDLMNNTSLAMAIEFDGDDRVLLFPADAQSGNWMSWHKPDVQKALKQNGGKDAKVLLGETVFYKVGHHGSHNGTASHSGLHMMNSKHLVAFMPLVQEKVPKAWGGPDNFPAIPLYDELIKKTRGRLVRTDEGPVVDPVAKSLRSQLSATEKARWKKRLVKGDLFFEFTVGRREED